MLLHFDSNLFVFKNCVEGTYFHLTFDLSVNIEKLDLKICSGKVEPQTLMESLGTFSSVFLCLKTLFTCIPLYKGFYEQIHCAIKKAHLKASC